VTKPVGVILKKGSGSIWAQMSKRRVSKILTHTIHSGGLSSDTRHVQ
jgi:hypothetical protein